jgi:tetratricopeptide (TPR) repeat protein
MKTSILQFHREAPALLAAGRFVEVRELAAGLSSHDEESAYLLGVACANIGYWEEAFEAFLEAHTLDPEDEESRGLVTGALVRLGRNEEALQRLQRSDDLSEAEDFRRCWLERPGERLAAFEPAGAILHPLYGTQRLDNTITVTVRGKIPEETLESLTRFHGREFPDSKLNFVSSKDNVGARPFEELRDLVDVGQLPDWAVADQLWLVVATSVVTTGYSAGVGADGIAIVKLESGDPFAPTIIAHELYHSLLGLNHTNGSEGPFDPTSVMGPLGTRAPLESTHIAAFHRKCCTTEPEVQELVEQGRWSEALKLDPDYLGLYTKVAEVLQRDGSATEAISVLEGWFERDPGPEAASVLGSYMAYQGLSPANVYEQTRGYDFEANTHLYLAQASLEAKRFREALNELNIALDLAPWHLHGLAMRARAFRGLGRNQEAIEDYREALEICPDWQEMKIELSELSD